MTGVSSPRWVAWFKFGVGIAIVWLWIVLDFTEQVPSPALSAIALGALLYTSIASGGYLADRGEWVVSALFGALVGATVLAARAVWRSEERMVDV